MAVAAFSTGAWRMKPAAEAVATFLREEREHAHILATRQEGPAIVEEYGSTVVVPFSWSVSPDAYGNLILEKSA